MDGRVDVLPQVRGVIVHPHHHLRSAPAGERERVHDEPARARLLGGGTESSRSSTIASAPRSAAFSTKRGTFTGRISDDRRARGPAALI